MGFDITVVPISPRYRAKPDACYGNIEKLSFRDVSGMFGHEQIVILRRRHLRECAHQKALREMVMENMH